MESQTQSTIQRIDVANDDLIEVLANLVEYERTDGESGSDDTLLVVGDGMYRMAVPDFATEASPDIGIRASALVEDGEVVDSIEIDGDEVEVEVF